MMGSWAEVFSRLLASVWSPGQFQAGRAGPLLILCCPLVAMHPIEQPEHKADPAFAGWQGAHGTGSFYFFNFMLILLFFIRVLMDIKTPDERKNDPPY